MYVRMNVGQRWSASDREEKSIGEEASGNSTSCTTNITAGKNPGLSGQSSVIVLSHACSLKTEVNANCI